ncbi:conserved hypothetical protein [Ricinus communis]|uniref:Uncharacterized protein n=1 Tax=Ricinus communis TaxID=3988 RepID=B9TPL9_RICCO|nr:conserved hypothetical protein [Ricinus communis]
MTISESRCQRVRVSSAARKMARDSIMGMNWTRLKVRIVPMASLGRIPLETWRTMLPARCATTIPRIIRKMADAEDISSADNARLNIFNLNAPL